MRLLIVDDEPLFLETLQRLFRRSGATVRTAHNGAAALAELERGTPDVVLLDFVMPGMDGLEFLRRVRRHADPPEVVLLTAHGTIESAVEAMKLGAYDYLLKPVEMAELEQVLRKAHEKSALRRENLRLRRILKDQDPYRRIVGSGPAMRKLRQTVEQLAGGETTVLLLGESGTGKELVARRIHATSPRAGAPFLTLNCGSLQTALIENELFGHVAGAFSGATKATAGLFEAADSGTLFIDEIGEMSLDTQRTLLRVLETGEFKRLGEPSLRHADTRILAATNRDLRRAVAEGRFREDLFYRLNVFPVLLPPLRDHLEDLPELAEHLLRTLEPDRDEPRRLSPAALELLAGHAWPGNVRELRNCLERALVLAGQGPIEPENLPVPDPPIRPPAAPADGPAGGTLEELERARIRQALAETAGNKTQAAKLLGISLRSLYNKLHKHQLVQEP